MAQTLQRRGSLVSDLPSRAPQNFVTNWGQHVNTYLQTAQMAKQLETEVKLNNLKTRARDLEIQVREQQVDDMERGNSYMHENASRWTMALSGMGDYELIQEIDAEVLRLNIPTVTQQWAGIRGPWGKAEYRMEGEEKPVSNAARMRKSLAIAAGAVLEPDLTRREQVAREAFAELGGRAILADAPPTAAQEADIELKKAQAAKLRRGETGLTAAAAREATQARQSRQEARGLFFASQSAFDKAIAPTGGRLGDPVNIRAKGRQLANAAIGYFDSLYPPAKFTPQQRLVEIEEDIAALQSDREELVAKASESETGISSSQRARVEAIGDQIVTLEAYRDEIARESFQEGAATAAIEAMNMARQGVVKDQPYRDPDNPPPNTPDATWDASRGYWVTPTGVPVQD